MREDSCPIHGDIEIIGQGVVVASKIADRVGKAGAPSSSIASLVISTFFENHFFRPLSSSGVARFSVLGR